ncbi:vWA domain-containing protein [Ammoniphilus resinae]|nr:VWA domain-containing protein [Ammoniphilus resinae]
MKFIVFNNQKVDTSLFLQLQDLACVLTRISNLKFEFHYGHSFDLRRKVITASHFWDNFSPEIREAGYKTDVFLRAIGTLQYTEEAVLMDYMQRLEDIPLKKFASQLFTLLEDLRLEELCKRERPGTARIFQIRQREYQKYFTSQLKVNADRGYELDELFCLCFLTLLTNTPDPFFTDANEKQLQSLEKLKPVLYTAFEAQQTKDVVQIVVQIIALLENVHQEDSLNEYFILPVFYTSSFENGLTLDDLRRKSKLKNEDKDSSVHENEEAKEKKMPTWHGVSKSEEQKAFLRFELESGTKTKLLGDTSRETEDGDQALGSVQGKSRSSKNKDYGKTEELENKTENAKAGRGFYGEENRDAVLLNKQAEPPGTDDLMLYQSYVVDVESHIRKLSRTIEKTLEHKKIMPRVDLHAGRLSKRLIPLVLEPFPRIFYKKNNRSKEIDAVFTLLVDCSASMVDKMEETKKGIILFHEVLKRLVIPHSIIGFWEDANAVKDGYQPNYFHRIKDFSHSVYSKSGAEILQLQPQEDNRDGFSIRMATQELMRRNEKNRFLLIFSDGEPAAANYDQNGIIDTKEAVVEARKKGIEVVGMFLSNGTIAEEDQKTMQNIYDKEHVLIPSITELPEQFTPLLKKLLLKSL